MYLDFATYRELGGTLDETAFAAAEYEAEVILDGWTLLRLRGERMSAKYIGGDMLNHVMFYMVEQMGEVDRQEAEAITSATVTSFSNGQNSFGFSSEAASAEDDTRAMSRLYAHVSRILPVELVSSCVGVHQCW